jgi:hypothetical protein
LVSLLNLLMIGWAANSAYSFDECFCLNMICGLYYKTITIVIDAPSVIKSDATIWSVTFDNTRSVDYNRNMAKLASSITFMVLASFTSITYDRQMMIVIVL